ncbi:MAG TPA: AMP-binding protein [bacterium]|nr:AMP-binding protein [bacterium]HPN43396.1 AMP-binding protein [bacterium]
MLEKYLTRQKFDSYEDFYKNLHINVPTNFNFAFDVVDEIAKKEPQKIALVWCDENGNEATFTFQQLVAGSNKAVHIFKKIGIRKGDPVMLMLKRRFEFWFCFLALHKIGAVSIPATHLLTTKDIIYRNNAADIKLIVTVNDELLLKSVDAAMTGSPSLQNKMIVGGSREGWIDFNQEFVNAPDTFERPTGEQATCNDDPLLIYFTSGTTGMPKMVMHNHVYPLGHIITASYWQNVRNNGLHLTVADTGWAKAVWGKIYGQWLGGSAVFVYDYEKFNAKQMLRVIEKYKITTFCAPPTIFRFFIKEDLSSYNFQHLQYCVIAGEPLNPEVYHQWLKATGIKLMEGYGQTEMTVAIGNFPWMEPRPGSMGKPSPGYDIDLLDENGESCPVGEEGQIVIRTGKRTPAGMFQGYYRDAELTKHCWDNNIYYTGDNAWRDEDGYYWFVGRADDVIKSSGYRIGPFEVESILLEHPAVLECAVTAAPDPVRGQVVKATIILTKNYTPGEDMIHELQEHVKHTTAPYKYPRIIEFVDALPKTISGKIRRVQIRKNDSQDGNE